MLDRKQQKQIHSETVKQQYLQSPFHLELPVPWVEQKALVLETEEE